MTTEQKIEALPEGDKSNVLEFQPKSSRDDLMCDGCKAVIFENSLYIQNFCHECVLENAKDLQRRYEPP